MTVAKPKILFVTQEFSSTHAGGAGVYAYELCKSIAENDLAEIHVIAPGPKTETRVICENLTVHLRKTIFKPLIAMPLFHLQVWLNASRIAKDQGIHSVHSNNCAGVTAYGRSPFLATIHHPVRNELASMTFLQRLISIPDVILERIVMNLAERILVPGHLVQEMLVRLSSDVEAKTIIVHHGVDVAQFYPHDESVFRKHMGIADETVLIFFPGGARAKRKGGLNFVHALQKIPKTLDYRCIISGCSREISWKQELETEVGRSGLADKLIWAGELSFQELPKYYAAADFVVYPSTFEGFGFPVLEAMASGKAVIATRTGEIPHMIDSGENSILIDVEDENELAIAVENLIRDKEKRGSLGSAARRAVLKDFSWKDAALKFVEEHKTVLAKRTS